MGPENFFNSGVWTIPLIMIIPYHSSHQSQYLFNDNSQNYPSKMESTKALNYLDN